MSVPAWLVAFQGEFAELLRQPLDRSSGKLVARTEHYPEQLVRGSTASSLQDERQRLAVYHRQYWFRLLDVLGRSFPLSARLVGHWQFNEPAALFLEEHPPRGRGIDEVADPFPVFYAAWIRDRGEHQLSEELLLEGLAVDVAFRAILAAPAEARFQAGPDLALQLGELRLVQRAATTLVAQQWPLLEARRNLSAWPGEGPLPPLAKLAQPAFHLIIREEQGTRHTLLSAEEARLFQLLGQASVGEALACFADGLPDAERATASATTQRFFQLGLQLGLWRAG